MTIRDAMRFVAYAIPGLIASATSSLPEALGSALALALACAALDTRLRDSFEPGVAFFATAALSFSVTFTDPEGLVAPAAVMLFAFASLAFVVLSGAGVPGRGAMGLAAALTAAPLAYEIAGASWWNVSAFNLVAGLWGGNGFLYGAPLMWAGILGLFDRRPEARKLTGLALAGLVPAFLGLAIVSDSTVPSVRMMAAAPFFLPGIAACFTSARERAARRPNAVLVGAGAVLILWNVLFMEQYRRRLLPSDDTVSFARVTSNAAALFSTRFGTPTAWPANWIFAARFDATPDRWDAVSGRGVFADSAATTAVIEVGDDPSLLALDRMLIASGFGERRTCERGWCRDVDDVGRLLFLIRSSHNPDFTVRLRVRGQGRLSVSLNGSTTAVADMTDDLNDVILKPPARALAPGIHVLSLEVEAGRRATVDRITLSRGP